MQDVASSVVLMIKSEWNRQMDKQTKLEVLLVDPQSNNFFVADHKSRSM